MVQTSIAQQLIKLNNLQNNTPPQNTPAGGGGGGGTSPEPISEFNGYATGFIQHGNGEPEFLLDGSSHVVLDPNANTVTANITANRAEFIKVFGVPIPIGFTNLSIGYGA
jgi:hypothetical protein